MRTRTFRLAPIALSVALAFGAAPILSGCDQTSKLSVDEHIQRARDFQAKGDVRASILELKNAVQKDPSHAQARWLLGKIYLDMRLGGEAETQFRKAVELGLSPASARVPLAQAQLYQGEFQTVLDKLVADDNADSGTQAQILDLRGKAFLGLDKYPEGCPLFDRAIQLDPGYAPPYLGRARCEYRQGQREPAIASARQATAKDPKLLDAWYLLGDLHRALNQPDAAISAYDSALRIMPNDYDGHVYKAMALLSAERTQDAEEEIKRLSQLRPNAPLTRYLNAYVLHQQGKDSEAANLLQQVLKDTPNNPQAHLLYGTVNYALKNDEIALSSLNKALGMVELPQARILVAATQLRMGAFADVTRTLEPLLRNGSDAKAYLLAGQALLSQGEIERGLTLLDRASRLAPQDTVIRTALAQNQLLTGDQQGIRGLESVITDNPSDSQAYLLLAASQVAQSNFKGALETLQKMAAAQPKNPLSHVLMGRVYLMQRNSAAARQSFERALTVDATFLPAAAALADLDIREKKPAQARERFTRILAKSPDNLGALMGQARVAQALGDTNAYIDNLKRAIEHHPAAAEPAILLTRHYLQKSRQPQQALALAQQAANANPDNPAFLDNLGEAQLGAGRTKDAIDTYTRLANGQPDSAAAWYRLAWAQRVAGNLNGALKSLQRAVQVEPNHLDSRIALAGLYVLLEQPDLAMQETRTIQKLDPKSPTGYNLEAELAARLKQTDVALQALARAFDTSPSADTAATYHLALLRAGKHAQAAQVAAQWLKRSPKDAAFRVYLAGTYLSSNQPDAARAQYQQVVKDHPDHVLALNNLAALLLERRDSAGYGFAQRAYALQPTNPVVMDTQGWALHLQGKAEEARPLLKQAASALPNLPAVQYHWAAALAQSGDTAQARAVLQKALASKEAFGEREEAARLLKSLPN
jgi:putative PEP-CTERM system TPR-repeat lipoprotein